MSGYYFSHDYAARSDDKMKALIRRHGMLGYGIFWAIVEDLYLNGNRMRADPEGIAFDLRTDTETVRSILHDFELFTHDAEYFGSASIGRRLEQRDAKSTKARNSAISRWNDGRENSRIRAEKTIFYIIRIWSESEEFIKAGITSESISRRYSGKLNGYNYEVIYHADIETNQAIDIETQINTKFTRYTPAVKFPGSLECYYIKDADAIKDFAMRHVTFRNATLDISQCYKGKEMKGKESKGKEINKRESNAAFAAPSLEAVVAFAETEGIGSRTAPQDFHDYYTSNGWKVGGRSAMKDWQAAFRRWTRNEKTYDGTNKQAPLRGLSARTQSDWDALQEWGRDVEQGRVSFLGGFGESTP